jgi:hypothetical protein
MTSVDRHGTNLNLKPQYDLIEAKSVAHQTQLRRIPTLSKHHSIDRAYADELMLCYRLRWLGILPRNYEHSVGQEQLTYHHR